jgi:hypothetical protein
MSVPSVMFTLDYADGKAIGTDDIGKDTIVWRWKNEVYEIPAHKIDGPACYNGFYYVLPVDRVRELAKEPDDRP